MTAETSASSEADVPSLRQGAAPSEHSGLRLGRAAFISVLCAIFFGLLSPIIDFKLGNTPLGSQHMAPGAIGALLLLVLVANPLLGRLNRFWRLSRDEMLVVYLSCLFSALVAGVGGHNYWPAMVAGSFYYATPDNRWLEILQALPSWMTPALDASGTYRESVVQGFYSGLSQNEAIPWAMWLAPLAAWTSLAFAALMMTGCLSVLLRAQWSDNEALAFPLLKIPLEMTDDVDSPKLPPFFRNRLMWVGFGAAAFLQLINGLNLYFPDVPVVATTIDAYSYFTESPWNQMGVMMIKVFPIAIGLSYILTAEISFSLWFFFLFFKFQYIIAYYLGFPPNSIPTVMPAGTKVFNGYQEVGAFLGITLLVLWTAREHLGHVLLRAFGKISATPREKGEALSYPVAFWGLVLSFALLIGWGVLAGAHPLVSFTYWSSYLIVSLVLARVLADSGLLFVSKIHAPLTVFAHLFGSGPGSMLGGQHAAASAMLAGTGDMRSNLMPSWVMSLKLVSDRKLPARPLFLLFCGVTMLSLVLAAWTHIRIAYDGGALGMIAQWTPRGTPQDVASTAAMFARGEPAQGPFVLAWTAVGMLSVFAMAFLRSRLMWFPLHPTGYVMGISWAMHNLWLSVFIGWAAKTLITRFGGNENYRKAIPLFLGLAIGDIVMMLFWLAVDGWFGRTGHVLTP